MLVTLAALAGAQSTQSTITISARIVASSAAPVAHFAPELSVGAVPRPAAHASLGSGAGTAVSAVQGRESYRVTVSPVDSCAGVRVIDASGASRALADSAGVVLADGVSAEAAVTLPIRVDARGGSERVVRVRYLVQSLAAERM
jgi:hypothetical protein